MSESPITDETELTNDAASAEANTNASAASEEQDAPAAENAAEADETAKAEAETEAKADSPAGAEPVVEASEEVEAEVDESASEDDETVEAEATSEVADAKAEAKTEVADDAKADTEAKAEDADDPKAEAKTEVAEDAKTETEVKAEDADDAKAEAKTEAAEESKTEADASTESAPADGASAEKESVADDDKGTDASDAVETPMDPALAPIVVAMEAGAPIEGKVIGWNKGGYHVALGQIAAFCPVSQIEVGNPRAPKRYLDRTFKFVVIDVAKDGRRVVVSRANALKAERKEKAARVKETIKVGSVLEGTVRSLTEFGVFVKLAAGIEGLVHISELSRRRVEHPKEIVKSGQKVKVKVLKVEKGGERISLSMKRLEADPWKSLRDRFPAGEAFTGTVKRKADFGLFVEVEPGIEGLVHTSRLPLGKSMEDESLAAGKTVEGWVQEVEPRRRRLALSLRPIPNAKVWEGVEDRFPIGSLVEGTVERVATFGAFIELEPGLTGLLPFSELRGGDGGGSGGGVNFKRQYHTGKKVQVRVLSIEAGRQRISLGTESSKAVGTQSDYRDFKKQQRSSDGLGAMAAAFAKLRQP